MNKIGLIFVVLLIASVFIVPVNAIELCLDSSDGEETQNYKILLDDEMMLNFAESVASESDSEQVAVGALTNEQKLELVNEIIDLSQGSGVIPLSNGRELLSDKLDGYGYFHYEPYVPDSSALSAFSETAESAISNPFKLRYLQDTPLYSYSDELKAIQPTFDGEFNADIDFSNLPDPDETMSSQLADYSMNMWASKSSGNNVIEVGLNYFSTPYDFQNSGVAGFEIVSSSDSLIELDYKPVGFEDRFVDEVLLKVDAATCDVALPTFFWTGLRGKLPDMLVVDMGLGKCYYSLGIDEEEMRNLYDPFADIYETGYIAVKNIDTTSELTKMMAYSGGMGFDGSISNMYREQIDSETNDGVIVLVDGVYDDEAAAEYKEMVARGGGYAIEIVAPRVLPNCSVNDTTLNLSEEKGKVIWFDGGKLNRVDGPNYLDEVFDEKESEMAKEAFALMKAESSSNYAQGLGTAHKQLPSWAGQIIGGKIVRATGIGIKASLYWGDAAKLSEEVIFLISEKARAKSLSALLTGVASGADDAALAVLASRYLGDTKKMRDAASLLSSKGVKINKTGNLLHPLGVSIPSPNPAGGPLVNSVSGVRIRVNRGTASTVNVSTFFNQAIGNGLGTAPANITSMKKGDYVVYKISEAASGNLDDLSKAGKALASELRSNVAGLTAEGLVDIEQLGRVNSAAITAGVNATGMTGKLYSIYGSRLVILKQMEALLAKTNGANALAVDLTKSRLRSLSKKLPEEIAQTVIGVVDNPKFTVETAQLTIKGARESTEQGVKAIGKLGVKHFFRHTDLFMKSLSKGVSLGWDDLVFKAVSSKNPLTRIELSMTLRGIGATGRGIGRFATGAVTLGTKSVSFAFSLVGGEMIGAVLSIGIRKICYTSAKIGGRDYGWLDAGLACTDDVENNRFICVLEKQYMLPTQFQKYKECLSNGWTRTVGFIASSMSFSGDAFAGIVDRDAKESLAAFSEDSIRDYVNIGVYSSDCIYGDITIVPPAKNGFSTNKDIGETVENPYYDSLTFSLNYNKERPCTFSTLVSLRPSKSVLGVLDYDGVGQVESVRGKRVDSVGEGYENYLNGQNVLSAADAAKYYALDVTAINRIQLDDGHPLDEVNKVFNPDAGEGALTNTELFYLRYGFLLKSKDFEAGKKENVIVTKATQLKEFLGIFFNEMGKTIREYIRVDKELLDAGASSINDSFEGAKTWVKEFASDLDNGKIVDDLALGYMENGSFKTVAIGKNVRKKYIEILNADGRSRIADIVYNKEEDSIEFKNTNVFDEEANLQIQKGIATSGLTIQYYGEDYAENKTKIESLFNKWSGNLQDVFVAKVSPYVNILSKVILSYKDRTHVVAVGSKVRDAYGLSGVGKIEYDAASNNAKLTDLPDISGVEISKLVVLYKQDDGDDVVDKTILDAIREVLVAQLK